jgi:formylmethanofuran dehydrogenase subunit E
MTNQVWKIMRALAGVENGSDCRSCGESIHRHDSFGRSERVCTPCRDA